MSRVILVAGLVVLFGFATLAVYLVSPFGRDVDAAGGRKESTAQVRTRAINPPRAPILSNWDCRLQLCLPDPVFDRDELIPLDLKMFNESSRPVTIWICGFWPNHRVVVRDEGGKEVTMTEGGRRLQDTFLSRARDKNRPQVIPPGESYEIISKDGTKTMGLSLSNLYQLERGKYRVEVLYQDDHAPNPMMLNSNSVEFEIR